MNNQWISVKDKLPPSKMSLLVWRPIDHKERPKHIDIIVGELAHESQRGKVWANGMYYDIDVHITHWMPLPEPPK